MSWTDRIRWDRILAIEAGILIGLLFAHWWMTGVIGWER